jgi:5-methylcytosine-specific restriction enzyme A
MQNKASLTKPMTNDDDDDDWRSMLHRDLEESRERKRAEKIAARGERAMYVDYEWQAQRDEQLERFPHCLGCEACGRGQVKAEIADHLVPRTHSSEPFFTSELQSLCKHCHDVVKRRLEVRYRAGEIKRNDLRMNSKVAIEANRGTKPGCDVDGMPTDPSHPWRLTLNQRKQS